MSLDPTMETAKFNVGGRLFEVSRSLIEQHSDTMLGKMVSETWQSDPEETVFIDRDGDIFAQVLNYLRYGSIELPITIPRSMFDREIDFYGIAATSNSIKQYSILSAVKHQKGRYAEAVENHDALLIALECYHEYVKGNTLLRWGNLGKDAGLLMPHDEKRSKEYGKLIKSYIEEFFGLIATKEFLLLKNSEVVSN